MVFASPSDTDFRYMMVAIREAQRGVGFTSPNPPVGCVIVREGRILATGYHRRAGEEHAEVAALRPLGFQAHGATAYVTLEPCNHTGKTGPCTEVLITAGIERVVVGVRDPHSIVDGAGIARLRTAGITVDVGVLEPLCNRLITPFRRCVTTGFPYLTLKLATSLDGRVADDGGKPVWLTGPDARFAVAELRHRSDAILVGVGTILSDNPHLTTRRRASRPGRDPHRVVLDSHLRTPPTATVLTGGATIFTTLSRDTAAARRLVDVGIDVVTLPPDSAGRVDLRLVLRECVHRGWHQILCETGPTLTAALLFGRWVQRIVWFSAPVLGGSPHLHVLPTSIGVDSMSHGVRITDVVTQRIGDDWVVMGDVQYPEDDRV